MENRTLNRKKDKITDETRRSRSVILFVVSAVQFLTPFMMSALGVALPAVGQEFSASAVQLGLVETVYILAVSLLLLPAGRLGDIYGRKKIFLMGTVLFTLATLLNATAWSMESFILFRFLQGSGASMITGTSVAILTSVFPREERGKAMGVIVACVYAGLSAGPALAGFMVTHMGWRWIFYAAVPVEMAALFLAATRLKGEWAEARGEKFDLSGSILYMGSLFCLIYGALNQGDGIFFRGLATAGAAGMGFFLLFETRTRSPLLDVRLILTNRIFAFSNMATMINYAASFGVTFFFSLYLQYVKGLSPQATGGILIIQPILQTLLSPFCGRLSDRYHPARIATLGTMICTAGLGIAATVHAGTSMAVIAGMLGLLGIGFALFSSPNMTTVMGSVAPVHYGMASSLVATMRTIGMLTSMTIITVIVTRFMGDRPVSPSTLEAFLHSMHLSMVVFSLLSCGGILLSMGRDGTAPEATVLRQEA